MEVYGHPRHRRRRDSRRLSSSCQLSLKSFSKEPRPSKDSQAGDEARCLPGPSPPNNAISMLLLSRWIATPARNIRRFAVAHSQRPSNDSSGQKNVRILRILEKRVDERKRLLSEVCSPSFFLRSMLPVLNIFKLSEQMSSPEDIVRLKQLKESEPLQAAWDDWTRTREVRPP